MAWYFSNLTLAAIAHRAMIERGLEPDFSLAAWQELAAIHDPAKVTAGLRDLRDRLWASIDSDDSPDLDQLTVAESLAGGRSVGSKASAWVTAFRVKLIYTDVERGFIDLADDGRRREPLHRGHRHLAMGQ